MAPLLGLLVGCCFIWLPVFEIVSLSVGQFHLPCPGVVVLPVGQYHLPHLTLSFVSVLCYCSPWVFCPSAAIQINPDSLNFNFDAVGVANITLRGSDCLGSPQLLLKVLTCTQSPGFICLQVSRSNGTFYLLKDKFVDLS